MKTIDTIIKEYELHYPLSSEDARKMMLEAQIIALEELNSTSTGHVIGITFRGVIMDSDASDMIDKLKLELEKL